jgi:beta-glucanase (GH16 family)
MNSANISLSDTFDNYHTYEIDWTPDSITWKVDGQTGRVKNRADTWNATANRWDFPQTPARVQLSLWPGGLASNAQGTIDWAGGLVDWNSPDIQNNGYYYAAFESVTISCFNGTSAPGTNSGVSYTYNDVSGLNTTVVDGKDPTVLGSFEATGENMSLGASKASGTSSGASKPSSTAQTVPGLSGAGPGTDSHSGSDSGNSNSGSSSAAATIASSTDSSGGSASTGSSSSGSGSGGFSQGGGSSGSSSSSKSGGERLGSQERVLKGSVFAGIVAVVAMIAL